MAASTATPLNLGFLTIFHEVNGYLGGYLVTNVWGRPLEFRLSSAVQPNRIQQILYGGALLPYICSDLIGKTLIEKTSIQPQLVLTDHEAALDLRLLVDIPVVLVGPANPAPAPIGAPGESRIRATSSTGAPVQSHPRFPEDAAIIRDYLDRLEGCVDLQEPFARIREALGEARKMGVTSRA